MTAVVTQAPVDSLCWEIRLTEKSGLNNRLGYSKNCNDSFCYASFYFYSKVFSSLYPSDIVW